MCVLWRLWHRAGCFFFQAEDGIRDLVRSRGLGDVYKRQDVESDGGFPRGAIGNPHLHAEVDTHARKRIHLRLSLIHI